LSTPFLDLSSFVSCCGERGLLSVAFHPQYASNRYFFVYYTNVSGDIEIARYQRMAANANQADPSTRAVLLTIPHPINANHNGGQLQFGPDGYLYQGTGDGGSANDPPCNAQNDAVALGKMLRIDVDQNVNTPPFYGVPPSNPHATQAYPLNLTWAKGLRNPFRFSFDRVTGDFWIGDVGQSAEEEIDFQPQSSAGGQNYGWKVMEGTLCGVDDRNGCSPVPPACGDPSYTGPLYEYDHTLGSCSVIGGYVYRGSQDLNLYGVYVYGDLCTGNLWGNGQLLTPTLPGLQTFGEDLSGELYLGTGGGGLDLIPPPDAESSSVFHGDAVPGRRYARSKRDLRRPCPAGGLRARVRADRAVRNPDDGERGLAQPDHHAAQRARRSAAHSGGQSGRSRLDYQFPARTDTREQRARLSGSRRGDPDPQRSGRRLRSSRHRRERLLSINMSIGSCHCSMSPQRRAASLVGTLRPRRQSQNRAVAGALVAGLARQKLLSSLLLAHRRQS
jgi:hypothetical protein